MNRRNGSLAQAESEAGKQAAAEGRMGWSAESRGKGTLEYRRYFRHAAPSVDLGRRLAPTSETALLVRELGQRLDLAPIAVSLDCLEHEVEDWQIIEVISEPAFAPLELAWFDRGDITAG
jgi:hypothetical protein